MKKYEEPKMKLHQLKTSKIMAGSIGDNGQSGPTTINDFNAKEQDAWAADTEE